LIVYVRVYTENAPLPINIYWT